MAHDPSRPPARDPTSLGLLALMLLVVVLWPGDVSWLLDEPRLIATAWHANHDGQLALGGLYGNFGIRYGPLPTQVYQLLLLVTHDPATLVILRAVLCAGLCGGGLWWLGRSLRLPGWFAAAALISPYVVAYQRVLWDASFAMPTGVLALAAFADFLSTTRAWSLRLCVLASVLAPTIHPQALPLAVPILGWLGWRHRAALWQDRRALAIVGLGVLLLDGFYFAQFIGQFCASLTGSVKRGYPGGSSHALSALAPLLGGRLLSGGEYLANLARPALPAWAHSLAAFGAFLFYPLAWVGIGVMAVSAWKIFRQARLGPASSVDIPPRDSVCCVIFAGLVFQAVLFGFMRIPAAPQYFFGTFALQVAVAWFGVDALRRWRLGAILGIAYGIASAVLTLEGAWSVHEYGYERPLWPTLASSVQVARELDRFADTTALTDVAVYQKSPQALRTLRLLLPPFAAPTAGSPHGLLITTAGEKPGATILREIPPDAPPSARGQWIEVTPLPKDWVPDPSTW